MQSWLWVRGAGRWAVGAAIVGLCGCASPRLIQQRPLPPPTRSVPAPPPSTPPIPAPVAATEGAAAVAFPVAPPGLPAFSNSAAPQAPVDTVIESEGVAARFPDPAVSYRTPAFEPGRTGYTSNAELRSLMQALTLAATTAAAPTVRMVQAGSSQTGVPIEALHFTRQAVPLASSGATVAAARPTVLLVGQQHGDEPAGAEALIVVAQALAQGNLAPLLERIDVLILPRANPDGALAQRRGTASGIDANRDHLLLRTPEAQAQAQLARSYNPVVVVDSHEFTVYGRYLEKFGGAQRSDALIQYAMVANLPEFVSRASEEWFRRPLLDALKAQGLSTDWYHTTSIDPADKKVSMGGVQPDTGRNVNGLRNAVSLLVETRGIGIGRAHLQRRVHTHVTAISSVLRSAAARADDLLKLRRFVDAEVTAKACHGEIVVDAAATTSEYTLLLLDPQTGADKPIGVTWDSALELEPLKRRARPCGYWLGADQTDAVLRLRGLGVQVQRLDAAGSVQGESYVETARELGERSDVRGSLSEAGSATPWTQVLRVKVDLLPALIDVAAGSYYVGLDQPLANLVIAALEPDTQNSFVANRIVSSVQAQARVLRRPESRMTPMQ